MPIYLFTCPKCKVDWDAFFPANDKKESTCPKCKKRGDRVFTKPNMGVGTKIDPHNLKALTKKTGDMRGTVGDLWDFSREMSEKRGGDDSDPIKKKFLKQYAKERGGKGYKTSGKARKEVSIKVEA